MMGDNHWVVNGNAGISNEVRLCVDLGNSTEKKRNCFVVMYFCVFREVVLKV